jgi:hypothetical protein
MITFKRTIIAAMAALSTLSGNASAISLEPVEGLNV